MNRHIKIEAGAVEVAGSPRQPNIVLAIYADVPIVREATLVSVKKWVSVLITPAEACMVAGALQAAVAQTPLDFSRGAVIGNVPDALDWANGVLHQDSGAGHFLKALAHAAQLADNENFPILAPALQVLMEKYPSYLEQERARR